MMKFVIDDQTIHDLELFLEKGRKQSIFSLFNYTSTQGGELYLTELLENPLTDRYILEDRISVLKYLMKYPDFIELDREQLKFIEIYMDIEATDRRFSVSGCLMKELKYVLNPDNELSICHRAVRMLGKLIFELNRWATESVTDNAPLAMLKYRDSVRNLIQKSDLRYVLEVGKLNMLVSGKLDFCFRSKEKGKLRDLLDVVYCLDALKTVASMAAEYKFVYPEFSDTGSRIKIDGLFHPFLTEAVPNDFEVSSHKNVCFLTGPNMAGKSTYMKSVGIAVYLAHIGFPVPAGRMELSIFKGLSMTINLSDNISLGYSHYYSEVMRVKQVGEQIAALRDMVVIFDELFRGTNVKDAYDASLAVISAFAGLNRSMFVISTHILEVASHLEYREKIDFRFFEIENNDGRFYYTYRLKPGVSAERIGMYILNRERVVETIKMAGEKS